MSFPGLAALAAKGTVEIRNSRVVFTRMTMHMFRIGIITKIGITMLSDAFSSSCLPMCFEIS